MWEKVDPGHYGLRRCLANQYSGPLVWSHQNSVPHILDRSEEVLPCSEIVALLTGAEVFEFKAGEKNRGVWVVVRALCGGNIFYTLKNLFDLF